MSIFKNKLLRDSCQVLVVTTEHFESVQGWLTRYERPHKQAQWKEVGKIPVVVGAKGLANEKREGDQKSPIGVFSLGPIFGHNPSPSIPLKMDYLYLKDSLEAVDDSNSKYYNQIVDRVLIEQPDWISSEQMSSCPLYELGIVVHYNYPDPVPHLGSAIFIHYWREESLGTAGCTAMSKENLTQIASWLDPAKSPILIQSPLSYKIGITGLFHFKLS